jgi:hypothetical protein
MKLIEIEGHYFNPEAVVVVDVAEGAPDEESKHFRTEVTLMNGSRYLRMEPAEVARLLQGE